jgi:GNAT superfamily N-acetyltransferase
MSDVAWSSAALTQGRYPTELEADIVVHSGTTLHLRPIRATDAEKLVAFHQRLSSGSIYRRYFSFHPVLTEQEVAYFTQVDYVNRLAFVVEDGSDLVAVGRYDAKPTTTSAEVAFIVRDDYQHLGIGTKLLDALAAAALERGITTFTAETFAENRGMLAVFHRSAFPVTTTFESRGPVTVRFPINQTKSKNAPAPQ